jgi:hypothetical protein
VVFMDGPITIRRVEVKRKVAAGTSLPDSLVPTLRACEQIGFAFGSRWTMTVLGTAGVCSAACLAAGRRAIPLAKLPRHSRPQPPTSTIYLCTPSRCRLRRPQRALPQQIVRQREQQHHRQHLDAATHRHLVQPAPPRPRVDPLRRLTAILVQRLRRRRAHPLPPRGHPRTVPVRRG